MKILNRFTGEVIFEIEAETVLAALYKFRDGGGTDLTCADLTWADLTRANLTWANLTDANLTDANLTDANLTCANLTRANLTDANLTDANLTDANLTWANLTRANLTWADLTVVKFFALIPKVENLDAKILAAINAGGTLNMQSWHGGCKTEHCRAGWSIDMAENGYEWEKALGTMTAATLIYAKSTGRVPNFFATNEAALEDIKACAKLAEPDDCIS